MQLPIPWKTAEPVWVPQRPLSLENCQAAQQLVQEQLHLGHLEPSVSPWNTPIFVIRKKSGKWRLLHDLRVVNSQMQCFGPVQRGLLVLSSLPKQWPLLVIDLKDCFFSIPLALKDRERFAFTIPSINHEEPDKRYQWKVLPHGMANSPTMCQLYVAQVLQPLRDRFPAARVVHYMDDILICAQEQDQLLQIYVDLKRALQDYGLIISSEKVQMQQVKAFLGSLITETYIKPQKISLKISHLRTLNDFQKLVGDINWLRPFLKISSQELRPLFALLEGDSDLASRRTLTPEAQQVIIKVQEAIEKAQLVRLDQNQPFELCVLPTEVFPTAVLWQQGPLLWIHSQVSQIKSIQWYPSAIASIVFKGLKLALIHFGHHPDRIIVPYTVQQLQVLSGCSNEWSILMFVYQGIFDNHFPRHPLLQFLQRHPVVFPIRTSACPLPGALTIFTDGSSTGAGALVAGDTVIKKTFATVSPQRVECHMVLFALQTFLEPLNIVSDSQYVVNAVNVLEAAGSISGSGPVADLFKQIQQAIWHRSHPFYITHIRAHSGLPGPLARGNALADAATRTQIMIMMVSPPSSGEKARQFHSQFHVSAQTLRLRFGITRKEARQIVLDCPACCEFRPASHEGVNPRGLRPNQLWQMDVTHVPSFGRNQFVHVSVDSFSGVLFASVLTGEKAIHVIQHCLEAWAAWGKPECIKTDNGPAYTSAKFRDFCMKMGVKLVTGIPYNPQGQGIIERAHRSIKELLQKQKTTWESLGLASQSPRATLALALFTINFLQLDEQGLSAADRHSLNTAQEQSWVKWKDVLESKWKGPDPVIRQARGAICVFPQDAQVPVWVPARLTRSCPSPPSDVSATAGTLARGNGC